MSCVPLSVPSPDDEFEKDQIMTQAPQAQPTGRVALVTGASRGIGQAIADALADQGHIVVGTATSESGAKAIDDRLGPGGGAGMCLDVADAESVSTVLAAITERFGAPLILVNNAGITRDNILMRMKEDEWQDVIDTNLSALYRTSKAVVRGMTKARWGRIVNITSVVGAMGNAGQSNYAASKAGAAGFSRALARELGSRNITVNAVAPGFIDTDMTAALNEDQRNAMLAQIPLARLGEANEIAALVAFLCGEPAAYITGETIHINGGMYMA
jgi:3-oxoacyl-[acyl-carrier protein] reductase